MEVIDYGRSFIGSEGPANAVRFWVESRACIIDETSGAEEQYVQCGACKSEHTFAERDLFAEDNYDFTPIFGPDVTLVFRQRVSFSEEHRQIRSRIEAWGAPIYRLQEAKKARLLANNAEIREATHAVLPLVAQTEWSDPQTGRHMIIEYPIKTMNVNDERNIYQVDTGPVLWMDLSEESVSAAEGLHLAYVAFNVPEFADFVVMAPAEIGNSESGRCRVHHYSRLVTQNCGNRLYALEA